MDTIAKVFDSLLCSRLERWFHPDREQAGAQKGRGCTEQIVTLRLLFDYALSKRALLFVVFVDFSKAYDNVPRAALTCTLKALGCGSLMMMAITGLYYDTRMLLGAAVITATVGVRQGSPTSCFLFTLYVNELVRDLKRLCGEDGYLSWLHSLLLMDDTVLLATSREQAIKKVKILMDYCQKSGMRINQDKTKFMVINGNSGSRAPIVIDNEKVDNCESYVYLGQVFTQDAKIESVLAIHCKDKYKHVLKFFAFVAKNGNFPVWVKKKVFEAVILSAILYSCESWLSNSVKAIGRLYMSLVKSVLGVRISTPNDLCLIELVYPTVKGRIQQAQSRFFRKIIREREGMVDDPFAQVWKLCLNSQTRAAKYVTELLTESDIANRDMNDAKRRVINNTGSKFRTYMNINPELSPHQIYSYTGNYYESRRIIFTRLRLSSHGLAIERGRWSRTPRDNRLCVCGQIQTEEHIICECIVSADIRHMYPNEQCYLSTTTDVFLSFGPDGIMHRDSFNL